MIANPVLRFELLRVARRRHHHAIRAAVGLATLLYVFWTLYDVMGWLTPASAGQGQSSALRKPARVADLAVLELAWVQGAAILLLVPGLVAGSVAGEAGRGSLIPLLASPLPARSILLGKLAGGLVPAAMAVAVGLPVVVPLGWMGALDIGVVARAYALLGATTLAVGSLALLISVVVRRPRPALVWSYLAVAGWLFLPEWYGSLGAPGGGWFGWARAVAGTLARGQPFEAAGHLWLIPMGDLFDPRTLAVAQLGLAQSFPRAIAGLAAASAAFLGVAVGLLRPLRLGDGRWGRGRARREPAAPGRPEVGDDPALWKERYARGGPPRWATRAAAAVLVAAAAAPLAGPASAAFAEWHTSWTDPDAFAWRRGDLNGALRQLTAGLCVAGMAAAAALGATSVAAERERGTWTALLLTPLTGQEVARARVSGSARAVRGLAAPCLAAWGIGLATGSVHPLGAVAAGAGMLVLIRYAAAVGVLCAMIVRAPGRAIGAALMILAGVNALALLFVPTDVLGSAAGSWSALALAGLAPLVEWLALLSPMEVAGWRSGRPWEWTFAAPGGFWRASIRLEPWWIATYLAGLGLHALGAEAAARAAAWAYDAQSAGPRRGRTRRQTRRDGPDAHDPPP